MVEVIKVQNSKVKTDLIIDKKYWTDEQVQELYTGTYVTNPYWQTVFFLSAPKPVPTIAEIQKEITDAPLDKITLDAKNNLINMLNAVQGKYDEGNFTGAINQLSDAIKDGRIDAGAGIPDENFEKQLVNDIGKLVSFWQEQEKKKIKIEIVEGEPKDPILFDPAKPPKDVEKELKKEAAYTFSIADPTFKYKPFDAKVHKEEKNEVIVKGTPPSVTVTIKAASTVYLPTDAGDLLKAHEDGHVEIAKKIVKELGELVARPIFEKFFKEYTGTGNDKDRKKALEKAVADLDKNIKKEGDKLCVEVQKELEKLIVEANNKYDEATEHGTKGTVEDQKKEADKAADEVIKKFKEKLEKKEEKKKE